LSRIYSSRGWKTLLACYGIRDRLLPANSRRKAWVNRVFHSISKR
jgi:hypothetical protein